MQNRLPNTELIGEVQRFYHETKAPLMSFYLLREFIFLQTKPKGVTTHMKALDEYILMVLFEILLKRVHFLANETQRCDYSNESS